MSSLHFTQVHATGDEGALRDWRYIHNLVIPSGPLSAAEVGAQVIETVILAANEDGLRFAQRHGFVETERYVLPGDDIPYVNLRLT